MSPEIDVLRNAVGVELLREILLLRGHARVRVNGTSMLPALWPGDVVEICRCEVSSVGPGEVVAVLRDDRLYIHRVVRITASGEVITRGDALSYDDPVGGHVLGRVKALNDETIPMQQPLLSGIAGSFPISRLLLRGRQLAAFLRAA